MTAGAARGRAAAARAAQFAWRFRTTILLVTIIVVDGIITSRLSDAQQRRLIDELGVTIDELREGRLYQLPFGAFFQTEPGVTAQIVAAVAFGAALLEWRAGWWRTLVTFLLADWTATIGGTLLAAAGGALGSQTMEAYAHSPDLGSSAGALGCVTGGAMLLPAWPRAAVSAGVLAWLAATVPSDGGQVGTEHIMAAAAGAAIGWLWWRRLYGETAAAHQGNT